MHLQIYNYKNQNIMIQNHIHNNSPSNRISISISLLTLFLCIMMQTQCLTKFDLGYPNRLRQLCENNNLTYFQHALQKTKNGNQIYMYGFTAINSSHPQNSDIRQFLKSQAVLINGVMHPRQDTSFIFIQNAILRLINMFRQQNQQIKYLLSRTVVLVMPFVNIDGVKYSFQLTKEQILELRKNLDYGDSKCKLNTDKGVDINRNFDYNFATQKTSNNECGQQYHGAQPFSQPESRSIKQIFDNFNVIANIDVHSYGNIWIYPYASEKGTTKIKNHILYPSYSYIFKKFQQKNVTYANCYESLQYLADGVYIDWALQQNSLSFAFQFGDFFDAIGSQLWKQIQAFIQVLKINTAAFQYYVEVESNQPTNQNTQRKFKDENRYKFCIRSLSTSSHNVTLVIDQKDIQTKLIQKRTNICYQSSFSQQIKLALQQKTPSKVQLRLGSNFYINLSVEQLQLQYAQKSVEHKPSYFQQIWKNFKIIIIVVGVLYCIGSLCGLSVFCEKAFGLTLHEEQSHRLSGQGSARNEVYLEQSHEQLEFQKQHHFQPEQTLKQ